jgi:hypothetical protein
MTWQLRALLPLHSIVCLALGGTLQGKVLVLVLCWNLVNVGSNKLPRCKQNSRPCFYATKASRLVLAMRAKQSTTPSIASNWPVRPLGGNMSTYIGNKLTDADAQRLVSICALF